MGRFPYYSMGGGEHSGQKNLSVPKNALLAMGRYGQSAKGNLKLEKYSCITTIIADIGEYELSCCLAVTARELLSRRGGSPTVPP